MFQSTPVITDERITARIFFQGASYSGFNPRPSLLTSESMKPLEEMRGFVVFQSTPVITDERILAYSDNYTTKCLFQSTPVITDERISQRRVGRDPDPTRFNPRPSLLTSESRD